MPSSDDRPNGPVPWRSDPRYIDRTRHMFPSRGTEMTFGLDPMEPSTVVTLVEREITSLVFENNDSGARIRAGVADLLWSLAPAFLPAGEPSGLAPNRAVDPRSDPSLEAPPTLGYRSSSSRGRIIGPDETVVSVQYHAVHVGNYGPIVPTYRTITFEALVVDHGDGTASRYVDWNFVMAQLGIVGTQRPMIGLDVDDAAGGPPVVRPRPDSEEPPAPAEAARPLRALAWARGKAQTAFAQVRMVLGR
jgi:hypothetical protein